MLKNDKPSRPMSNFEVMQFLQEKKDAKIKPKKHLATIIYETMRYFENTDCINQTEKNITSFLKDIESFPIPKQEKLALINIPPRRPIDVQILIQFSEDLFNEEAIDQLIKLAAFYFPEPVENEEENTE